jgi:hypothetical protein
MRRRRRMLPPTTPLTLCLAASTGMDAWPSTLLARDAMTVILRAGPRATLCVVLGVRMWCQTQAVAAHACNITRTRVSAERDGWRLQELVLRKIMCPTTFPSASTTTLVGCPGGLQVRKETPAVSPARDQICRLLAQTMCLPLGSQAPGWTIIRVRVNLAGPH